MSAPDTQTESTTKPVQPWIETYGIHLCGMALALGLPVEQVSLIVGGILANLTTPDMVVGSAGTVSSGINLIALEETNHRSQRLADHLFQPVFALQHYFRQAAQRTSRMWGDLFRFGPENLKEWQKIFEKRPDEIIRSRLLELQEATGKDLQWGDGLPRDWESPEDPWPELGEKNPAMILRQRVPGFRQQPSFVLRPGELTDLAAMMNDVADQHAFIVDAQGRLFQNSDTERGAKWNTALRDFGRLMGGEDVPMPRLHPDQGHGRLTCARAALFSAMSTEVVLELLDSQSVSPGRLVVEEAILWKPMWQPVRALREGIAGGVWADYKRILERLLNARASRTVVNFENTAVVARAIELLEVEVTTTLDAQDPLLRRYLRPFGGLVGKLFWAFRLLQLNDDQLPKAVRATVLYALKNHVVAVETALSQAEVQRAAVFARRVEAVLRQKGPCTVRVLQRSIFQCKRPDLDLGLEQLLSAGRVAFAQYSQEYHIPSDAETAGSCTSASRTRASNTAHG